MIMLRTRGMIVLLGLLMLQAVSGEAISVQGNIAMSAVSPESRVLTDRAQTSLELELIGQIGGNFSAVAVQGNYGYLGEGRRLVVLDVSDPTNPIAVARTAMLPCEVAGVAPWQETTSMWLIAPADYG